MRPRPHCSDSRPAAAATASAWVRAFAAGRQVRVVPAPLASDAGVPDRAWQDVQAAWHRWHEPLAWADVGSDAWPFACVFERARVERLAAAGWPGMAGNLADSARIAPRSAVLRPLYLCARYLAEGDRSAAERLVDDWVQAHGSATLGTRIARWLGSRADSSDLGPEQAAALAARLRELLAIDGWRSEVMNDAAAFAAALAPLARRCAGTLALSSDERSTAGADQPLLPLVLSDDPVGEEQELAAPDDGLAEPDATVARAYPGYAVFSPAADEVGPASRWYREADRALLDQLNQIDRSRARRLAHRLQRRLEAARARHWAFDQEDGLIDSRRLARLVVAGSDQRVFRQELPALMPSACVSLLVDMSGSMSGQRRLSAALAIDLAVHVLEICGVHCEVLGFTTVDGADNPVERAWRAAGGPDKPGRLNGIRHIVFKGARQPWRRSRRYLGLLLREEFGHENIDGEALHWAAQRLFVMDAQRRILIVLSDGAPFDQATAGANGREYLCAHLREVIARLESLPLHLLAMGTGTDVSRFYRQAVTLDHPDAVAETLFDKLGDLLTLPSDERDSR